MAENILSPSAASLEVTTQWSLISGQSSTPGIQPRNKDEEYSGSSTKRKLTEFSTATTTSSTNYIKNSSAVELFDVAVAPSVIDNGSVFENLTSTEDKTTVVPFLWSGNSGTFGEEGSNTDSLDTIGLVDELAQFNSTSTDIIKQSVDAFNSEVTTARIIIENNITHPNEPAVTTVAQEPVSGKQEIAATIGNSSSVANEAEKPEKIEERNYVSSTTELMGASSTPGLENINFAETTGRASSSFNLEVEENVDVTGPSRISSSLDNLKSPEPTGKLENTSSGKPENLETAIEIPTVSPIELTESSKITQGQEVSSTQKLKDHEVIATITPSSVISPVHQRLLVTTQTSVDSQFFHGETPPLAEVSATEQKFAEGRQVLASAPLFSTRPTFLTEQETAEVENRSPQPITRLTPSPLFPSISLSPSSPSTLPLSSSTTLSLSSEPSKTVNSVSKSFDLMAASSESKNASSIASPQITITTVVPVLSPHETLKTLTSIGSLSDTRSDGSTTVPESSTPSAAASRMAIDDFAYSLEDLQLPTSRTNVDDFAYSLEEFNSSVSGHNNKSSAGTIQNITESSTILTEPEIAFSSIAQNITVFKSDSPDYKEIDKITLLQEKKLSTSSRTIQDPEISRPISEDVKNPETSTGSVETRSSVGNTTEPLQISKEPSNISSELAEKDVLSGSTRTSTAAIDLSTDTSTFAEYSNRSSIPNPDSLASLSGYWRTVSEQSFATATDRLFPFADSRDSVPSISAIATSTPPDAAVFVGTIGIKNRPVSKLFGNIPASKITNSAITTAHIPISTKEVVPVSDGTSSFSSDTQISFGGSFGSTVATKVTTTINPSPVIGLSKQQKSSFSSPAIRSPTASHEGTFSTTETSVNPPENKSTVTETTGSEGTMTTSDNKSATTETSGIKSSTTEGADMKSPVTETIEPQSSTQLSLSELRNTMSPTSLAVFNVTIPSTMLDVETMTLINRTSKDYNYLLLDEIDYSEKNELPGSLPKAAASIDEGSVVLTETLDEANEPYNDLYSYEVTDTPLPSVDEIALQRLNLLLKSTRKPPTKQQLSSLISTLTSGDEGLKANVFTIPSRDAKSLHGSSSTQVSSLSHNVSIINLPEVTLPPGSPEDITSGTMITQEEKDQAVNNLEHETKNGPDVNKLISNTTKDVEGELASTTRATATLQSIDLTESEPQTKLFDEISSFRVTEPEVPHGQSEILLVTSTTPKLGIEEIAPLKINHRKTIHQASTILKPEQLAENGFPIPSPFTDFGISASKEATVTGSTAASLQTPKEANSRITENLRNFQENVFVPSTTTSNLLPQASEVNSTSNTKEHESNNTNPETTYSNSQESSKQAVDDLRTNADDQLEQASSTTSGKEKTGTTGTLRVVGNNSEEQGVHASWTTGTNSSNHQELETPDTGRSSVGTTELGDISGDASTMINSTFGNIPEAVIFFSKHSQPKRLSANGENLHKSPGFGGTSKLVHSAGLRSGNASEVVPDAGPTLEQKIPNHNDSILHLRDELASERLTVLKSDEVERIRGQASPIPSYGESLDGSGDST